MASSPSKSVRVAAAATIVIGVASQTAMDVATRAERSAIVAAAQPQAIRPNIAVMRVRTIRQLRTLTLAQRTRIDETLGRHRQALRDAATVGDQSKEVESLLTDVENLLTPIQRRQVDDDASVQ